MSESESQKFLDQICLDQALHQDRRIAIMEINKLYLSVCPDYGTDGSPESLCNSVRLKVNSIQSESLAKDQKIAELQLALDEASYFFRLSNDGLYVMYRGHDRTSFDVPNLFKWLEARGKE